MTTTPPLPSPGASDTAAPDPASRTLVDDIYRRLLIEITSGRLAPRQKLAFDMLRQTYGCSVSTLREALQRLNAEGLVSSRGHVGFTVASVSLKELTDLNMLRLALEPLALDDSIHHGGPQWEKHVLLADHRLKQTPIPKDLHSPSADIWEDAHRDFHDALIAGCSNVMLLTFSRTLFQQVRRYRRIFLRRYWTSGAVRRPVEREHRAIVEATLSRDAERAKQALYQHYANGFERMKSEYEDAHSGH